MNELKRTIDIIDKLRKDCPSDKIRDYKDIILNIKKETIEIEDALKNNDFENVTEEIGDVLFNIIFFSRILKEEKNIDLDDVLKKVNNKIVFRHPYVFENPQKLTIEEAHKIWIERKKFEKDNNIIH